jgi:hypothetical protein
MPTWITTHLTLLIVIVSIIVLVWIIKEMWCFVEVIVDHLMLKWRGRKRKTIRW